MKNSKKAKRKKEIQKMDKSYIKKQKLTKYVGKKYNFQVISLKVELEILEKLVEEYLADGIIDTFKSIIDSIEEEFEQLNDFASDKKIIFKESFQVYFNFG